MKEQFSVYKELKSIISENENADPSFESDCLLIHLYDKNHLELPKDFKISKEDYELLISYANKRKEGYPLQYILGKWEFLSLELKVGEGVLIPRQDTETVCLNAIEIFKSNSEINILDLCSGSGAIALALKKHLENSTVVAVEKYKDAYDYLLENIKLNDLQVLPIQADIFNFDYKIEDETFDLIISNPPYVDPAYEKELQTEVTFEPKEALFAQDYGLRYYKFIAQYYYKALKYGGYLIFEHGFDQHENIKRIIQEFNYTYVKEIIDLNNVSRGLIARKN